MSLSAKKVRIQRPEIYTFEEFLEKCVNDRLCYATAEERILAAFGEPEVIDTSKDQRLSRLHQNRIIKRYPGFQDSEGNEIFFGLERVIEQIHSFFKHAAQGGEERKQILYLKGPVSGGKSSLAEQIKSLVERNPIFVVQLYYKDIEGEFKWVTSPVFEHPLGVIDLFAQIEKGEIIKMLEEEYSIPARYMQSVYNHASPWMNKHFNEWVASQEGDDIDGMEFLRTNIRVIKLMPSIVNQIGVVKTEPGDENNQDISSLVGKVDMRKLVDFAQDDPDAYSYSGALCRANQGLMEFVEMFKAPIKTLHPLLTATQEGNYNGVEGVGAFPFTGAIIAHSNESEWDAFKGNKNNVAFLDRICLIDVPYSNAYTENAKIFDKVLKNANGEIANAPCVLGVTTILAKFCVASRIQPSAKSPMDTKVRVYDGQNLKDVDPGALTLSEYQSEAGPGEGMEGISNRWAFKLLFDVFNYDAGEIAANPIHLFYLIQEWIEGEFGEKGGKLSDTGTRYMTYLDALRNVFAEELGDVIKNAYIESADEYGQNVFDRYMVYADYWIQDNDYVDPNTGERFDRGTLNDELSKIEKSAKIANPKDFRNELVNLVLRYRADHEGKNPDWRMNRKFADVIKKNIFSNMDDLLPMIGFTKKRSSVEQEKHNEYVARMQKTGCTEKQVQLLSEWYVKWQKKT